jgi:predicted dehydrogenase
VATDLLYHKLAPLLLAIAGPDGQYPLRVNAAGGLYVEKDGRDIPDTFLLTADYPGEFSILLVSTLTNDTQIGDRIYGKHGTLELGGESILRANGDFGPEFRAKNDGKPEARLPHGPRRDMVGNFLDVIRGGGPLHCNVELGAATMVAIKMAVESYRQRKTMTWSAALEKVVES